MKRILITILLLVSCSGLWATAVKFEAKLSHQTVEVGQRFQISFTLNTSGGNFKSPSFDKFRVLSGPNQSSSTQIINGNVSRSFTLSYILQATEAGNIEIGPASIQVEGETYKTRNQNIKVVKASSNSANAQRNRQQQRSQTGEALSKEVFIRAFVDKQEAYVGEKITVTYKLYTRLRLANPQMEAMPALSGFWHQELRSIFKDEIQFKQERFGNKVFDVAEIQQNVLYPQRSGELIVDPLKLKFIATVQRRKARTVYEQMFGSYERKEVIAASKPIKVKVKPLPLQNKPDNFTGAVGVFNANLLANKESLKSNEAIDVQLIIEGKGNLPLLSAPKLNFPPDFEVYDPETESKFKTNYNGSSGKKIFNYLVIPRHAGEYDVAPFEFSYFDLKSESYKTINTEGLNFQVARGAEEESLVYRANRKQDVALLEDDIRFIHTNGVNLLAANELFYGSAAFYASLICSLGLILLLWMIAKKRKEKQGDTVGLRKSRANKLAKKRLTKAKKHLDQNEKTAFYEEISEALFGYYADKYNIEKAALSQEKIIETLQQDDLKELGEDLKVALDAAEMARFAPTSAIEPTALYEQAMGLIQKSENHKAS